MGGQRKGKGRHCADASAFFFSLSLFFVNGRAERLGRAEMRRLHFYEWGGLRMALRRRDAEIFMNGKKWRMRRVCMREQQQEEEEGR